jgi:hypothetical protein
VFVDKADSVRIILKDVFQAVVKLLQLDFR